MKRKGEPVSLMLDAFIISGSSYNDIKETFRERNYKKEDFEKHNILFQEDETCIPKMLEKAGVVKND